MQAADHTGTPSDKWGLFHDQIHPCFKGECELADTYHDVLCDIFAASDARSRVKVTEFSRSFGVATLKLASTCGLWKRDDVWIMASVGNSLHSDEVPIASVSFVATRRRTGSDVDDLMELFYHVHRNVAVRVALNNLATFRVRICFRPAPLCDYDGDLLSYALSSRAICGRADLPCGHSTKRLDRRASTGNRYTKDMIVTFARMVRAAQTVVECIARATVPDGAAETDVSGRKSIWVEDVIHWELTPGQLIDPSDIAIQYELGWHTSFGTTFFGRHPAWYSQRGLKCVSLLADSSLGLRYNADLTRFQCGILVGRELCCNYV